MTTGVPGRCVGIIAAVPRLGLPEMCLDDGPIGVRSAHGVSQFPAGVTTAATWDRELTYLRAKAMGEEFYDQGVHIPVSLVINFCFPLFTSFSLALARTGNWWT